MELIRYKGKWIKIIPKPYEPERRTRLIAWMMVRDGLSSEEANIMYFNNMREENKVLFPSFRKDGQ